MCLINHVETNFDNELDVHVNLENYEAKDSGHSLKIGNHLTGKSVFHNLQEVGVKLEALIYHMHNLIPKTDTKSISKAM